MHRAHRRTKIVCTLGPSTDQPGVLEQLVKEGMNVARFNFSHGTHEEQLIRLNTLKEIRSRLDKPIAALLDTKGPEIRLGTFKDGMVVNLVEGQEFFLTTQECEGDEQGAFVSWANFHKDVKIGNTVLIDDGLVGLEVIDIKGKKVICRCMNNGAISGRKSINLPGVKITMPFISEKDYNDLLFAVEHQYEFVAASFTRTAADVHEMRKILVDNGAPDISIIAKIENQQGVDNIDSIIAAADGIMVARGDMGVEIPLEDVPVIQKMIIKKCYKAGKQVITATQMLDSMMKNPRPTRAEATDVANAIYQGTSAVMLSGETAAGKYPVEAVKTMVKIAYRTEADINYDAKFERLGKESRNDMTTAISHATCITAIDLEAKAIITISKSGHTPKMISRFRPSTMIIGCSPDEHAVRKMSLVWGVVPVLIKEEYSMEALILRATDAAQRNNLVKDGDTVILTAGVPIGVKGNTNLLKTQIIGESR